MSKPKAFDSWTEEDRAAWRAKQTENCRKWNAANPEKARENCRKSRKKVESQAAADQFFLMTGATEQITKITKP